MPALKNYPLDHVFPVIDRHFDAESFLSAVVSRQTKNGSLCALCVSAVKSAYVNSLELNNVPI
jgi:hypothetical protein